MGKSGLEPGFLQVFRIYAWLRLASLLFLPLIGLRARVELQIDLTLPIVLIAVESFLLLVYLYWPWLADKLGRYYIPAGLVMATAALIIEQHFFLPQKALWQLAPYLYILLILVAWQYDYRQVVGFVLCTAALEVLINLAFPQADITFFLSTPSSTDRILNFSRLVTLGLIVSRSLTFLVLGYVVTRLVKAQRVQRQALAQANQKLVRHAAALEQLTISRERIRLSRELHDTLAHTLSALTVQIEAVITVWEGIPRRAREVLDQVLATTRSGLDETRRALSALRASPLEEMGLALAVRTMAEDFAARNSLSLELDMPDNLDDLSPEVEQCYYRVTQEALENIARHAGAGRIALRLHQDSGALALMISDDGRGFDPRELKGEHQLGIQGMRERAELIGGNLALESQPGGGTTVRLRMEG